MTADPALDLDPATQARVIAQALPYMQRYENKTIVVKYGGHAMGDAAFGRAFAQDVAMLKQSGINPIVVHGGGPQIGAMLERMGIKSSFEGGLRVTDRETVEIVEMVLSGAINKQLAAMISAAGGVAVGLSGKDGGLIRAEKLTRTKRDPESNIEKVLDLGFVGEPKTIDTSIIGALQKSGIIPIIAPIGIGPAGETFNINADTVAGAVAAALQATRLLLLTDVAGVKDKSGTLMPELTDADVRRLIGDGTITGGMIPKVETCLEAVDGGVEAAVILDGRVPHSVLLEIFTEHGVGTLIRREA